MLAAFLARHGARVPFDVWALPRATPVFARAGFAPRGFAEAFDPAVLRAAWQASPARFLVTGTSHYEAFEPLLWGLARDTGAESLAVIDGWSNLPLRFAAGRPDFVGAVDLGQIEELVALGFRRERTLLTGHPWLSLLIAERSRLLAETPPAVTGPGVNLLFASEALAGDVAKRVNVPYGFDEFDAFALLHRAARQVVQAGRRVNLAVKFHPYEEPAAFLTRLGGLPLMDGLTVLPLEPTVKPHPWVLWADLVVGITSVLLLEAIVLGRPVISVQPGLAREDTFIASHRGFAEVLTDPEGAVGRLAELIGSGEGRQAVRERNAGFLATLPGDGSAAILDLLQRDTAG
jgi:hypothetical protein